LHILLAILGLLSVAAIWWYRMKFMASAASEAADTAGKLRGAYRRRKIRSQSDMSILTAIEDPVVAAATVVLSIVSEDAPPREAHVSALTTALATLSTAAHAEEAVTYAKWVTGQINQATTVIDKVGPILRARLTTSERDDVLRLLDHVADAGPQPTMYRQRVSRLCMRLGAAVV